MTVTITPIRTAGIASGLALAALLVLAFRVPASSEMLGAGVRFTAMAPGEVHVPSTDSFLEVGKLTPGGRAARATLPVTNVTRGPVDVRMRARMASHDLDRAVRVEVRAIVGRDLVVGVEDRGDDLDRPHVTVRSRRRLRRQGRTRGGRTQ